MLSIDVENSINTIFRYALKRRHEFVTAEHLLLSMLDNSTAAEVLQACNTDVAFLRAELEAYIEKNTPLVDESEDEEYDIQATSGLTGVLQQAVYSAQAEGKEEITGDAVLLAIFDAPDSNADYFLGKCNISKKDVVDFLAHGTRKGRQDFSAHKDEESTSHSVKPSPYGFSIRRISEPVAESQSQKIEAKVNDEVMPPESEPEQEQTAPPESEKSIQNNDKEPLYCSFCGKSKLEVRKLIAGTSACICDECAALCIELVGEDQSVNKRSTSFTKVDSKSSAEQIKELSAGRFSSASNLLSCVSAIAGSNLVSEVVCRRNDVGQWWLEVEQPIGQVAHIIWSSGGQPFSFSNKQWIASNLSGDLSSDASHTGGLDLSVWMQVDLADVLASTTLGNRPIARGIPEVWVISPPALSQWIFRRAVSLGVSVGITAAIASPLGRNKAGESGVLLLHLRVAKGDVPLSLMRTIDKLPYTIVTRPVGFDGEQLLVDVNSQLPLSEILLSQMIPHQSTWVLGSPDKGHWRLVLQGSEVDGTSLLDSSDLDLFELPADSNPRMPDPIPVRMIRKWRNSRTDAVLLDDQELDWVRIFMASRPTGEAAFILPGPGKHLFTAPGGLSEVLPFGVPLRHLKPGGLFLDVGLGFYPALPEIAREKAFSLEDGVVVVVTENKVYRFYQKDLFPAWALWVGEVMSVEVSGISDKAVSIMESWDPELLKIHGGIGRVRLPMSDSQLSNLGKAFDSDSNDVVETNSNKRGLSFEQAQQAELSGDFSKAAEIMESLGEMAQAGRLYEKAANQIA